MLAYSRVFVFDRSTVSVVKQCLLCLSDALHILWPHQELREKQVKQQAVLEDLHRVKEEKLRELQRRREEEMERRRREEEEAAR